ncbi:MAG: HAD family phosphatase [Methylococcales bacterium]|nr:HAD family phosphatase [Methylococcaceae bacterium]
MIDLADFAAVIFDMDGLVLDTESTYIKAWQQTAEGMGFELGDDFGQAISGLQHADVERLMLAHCGADFDLAAFNQLSASHWRANVEKDGIAVKAGFAQLLNIIKQQALPFALATNSPKINAHECLALAGLKDLFPLIVTCDDVQHGKPAPDIYLHTAACLQADIKQCLVIEDSPTGVAAAVNAGAFCVYVPSTFSIDAQAAKQSNWVVNDLVELALAVSRA